MHPRGDEIGCKSGDTVGDTRGESGWQGAGSSDERTAHERIGIGGKDLVVVVVSVVEEEAGIGDAVFGGDD